MDNPAQQPQPVAEIPTALLSDLIITAEQDRFISVSMYRALIKSATEYNKNATPVETTAEISEV